ncbi:MAG: ParB/RepB/Spo0J family partition protein [Candidatus Dormibacteria bacterium]
MSKRKGDFRSKIDSILADEPAASSGAGETSGLDRMFGAQGSGDRATADDTLSRHVAPTTETKLDEIDLSRIKLPRGRRTDADSELHDSIAKSGILQPLLLRPTANGYEVLDGGRRLAVARDRGLKTVPAVVRTIGDVEARAMTAERRGGAAKAVGKAAPGAAAVTTATPTVSPTTPAPVVVPGVAPKPAVAKPPTPSVAKPRVKVAGPSAAVVSGAAARPAKPTTAVSKAATPAAPRAVAKAAAAKGPAPAVAPSRAAVTKRTPTAPNARATARTKTGKATESAAATAAAAATVASAATARPSRKVPARRDRAAAAVALPEAPAELDTETASRPAGGADETVVLPRPSSTSPPAKIEETGALRAGSEADAEKPGADDETVVLLRDDDEKPSVPGSTAAAPAIPRTAPEPAQRQVAAASAGGGDTTTAPGSAGRLLADWVFFPLGAGALAFAATNLVFFNNLGLFLESGAVCVFALAVFGVLYLAGRRTGP